MKITRRAIVSTLVGILVVGTVGTYLLQSQQPQAQRSGGRFRGFEGPVPVLVAPAKNDDVPIYLDGVGTTRALNTVTVKPQVDGKLSAAAAVSAASTDRCRCWSRRPRMTTCRSISTASAPPARSTR